MGCVYVGGSGVNLGCVYVGGSGVNLGCVLREAWCVYVGKCLVCNV